MLSQTKLVLLVIVALGLASAISLIKERFDARSRGRTTTPVEAVRVDKNNDMGPKNVTTPSLRGGKPERYCNVPDGGPTPVVLLTSGRSGSGSTWQIITNLTGQEVESDEYSGKDPDQAMVFFHRHKTGDWLPKILCEKQKEQPTAGVVGIKMKPHSIQLMQTPGAVQAMKWIRDHPNEVRLVRSRRNPLDVLISKHKHLRFNIPAHCFDVSCQKQHLKDYKNLSLPTENLVAELEELTKMEDYVDKMLREMNVPFVSVTYGELYYGKDASEWMKIFQFIGRGPTQDLTLPKVHAAMEHLPTSSHHHNTTLANFRQVQALLEGTKYEGLLH